MISAILTVDGRSRVEAQDDCMEEKLTCGSSVKVAATSVGAKEAKETEKVSVAMLESSRAVLAQSISRLPASAPCTEPFALALALGWLCPLFCAPALALGAGLAAGVPDEDALD